jgi:hypothetical protein
MTASAAATAGYTLAAGPVRADVIQTDSNGLAVGDVKIKVADGEMPGYFAGRLGPDAGLVQEIQRAGLIGTPPAYPKRSLLRCGLDVCSISQSIHTKAVPNPMTTPRNSNVRPGAVSMVNIRDAMQAAYQRMTSRKRPQCRIHQGRPNLSNHPGPQLYLTGPIALPDVDRSRGQPQTWTGWRRQPYRVCTRRCTT